MSQTLRYDGSSGLRLGWLMFFRVVVVSFLLGIAAFIQFKGTASLSRLSLYSVYFIIGITYFLSIFYAVLFKRVRNVAFNVDLQSLFDVLLITVLVYVTGGIESQYSTLYPLVIIYSAIFHGLRGGVLVASASSILYGVLLDLEFYGVIHPLRSMLRQYEFTAGYIFSRIFIHIVSFYIIALITSFLVEREKKAQVLLSEKEDAFDSLDMLHQSIIESIDAGILTVDSQGTIKSFNRAAEDITGYPSFEVREKKISDVFPNISQAVSQRVGAQKRFEYMFSSRQGKATTLGFSFSPLVESRGKSIGTILIFQDLTAIKEMESEMEKNKRLALIGEMSAFLAHELRSPLASIGGSIELLSRDLDLVGSDKKLVDIILRGKNQLENLARDFLLLARPSIEKRSVFDVQDLVDSIVETIKLSPDWNDRIEIEKRLCENNTVEGNKTAIRQALMNIVENSVQAMPEGGKLKIESETVITDTGDEVLEIVVHDTGTGIDRESLDKVTEPFFTTKEQGTGLGLAIVNRVVESHNGTFFIESEMDKGSRCTIVLPRDLNGRA